MMGPILYDAKERDFKSLGMGVLVDEIETLITEEKNGQFYAEMEYPVDGHLFEEIQVGRLIKANASPVLRGQQFKVIRINTQAKGIARVYAEHVSNQTAELQLKPGVEYDGTAKQALGIWQDSIVTRHDFETHSDITTKASGEWDLSEIENARQALGGTEQSILDQYKGEYLFDNYQIHLLKNRGKDKGLIIAYGKNLVDIEQEQEIASTYTSVMPYSTFTPERVQGTGEVIDPITVTLPEYFVDSDHADKFARRKIKKVDFSDEEIDNVGELRLRTEQYIREENIGVPKVNLKVQMLDLAQTENYKGSAHPENIGLCDWVTVYFKELNINQKVQVTRTVFNHTADRYEEIELGESRSDLSHAIDASLGGRFDDIYNGLNTVQASADGKNKVFRGVVEPKHGMVAGDIWYKPIGVGEHLMHVYDGNTWGDPVTDHRVNREVDLAIEEAEKKVEEAREHTEKIEKDANSILEGLGIDPIGETHKEIVDGIKGKITDEIGNLVINVGDLDKNVNDRITGLAEELGEKPSKVFVNQSVDKAKGEITSVISGITDDPEGTIIGYNAMKSTVNGNVREIGRVSDKAGSLETKYNQVKETADMFTRTIGTSEEGIKDNVARIVMSDSIFRTQVSNQISGMSTKVTQLEGSWALRIESNDELVSAINASEEGVHVKGKNITFDGEVFSSGDFTITGDMIADTISANKVSGGELSGIRLEVGRDNINPLLGAFRVFSNGTIWAGNRGFKVPHDADGVYNSFARDDADGTEEAARWKRDYKHYIYQDTSSVAFYMDGLEYSFRPGVFSAVGRALDIQTINKTINGNVVEGGNISLRPANGQVYSDGNFRPYTTNKHWLGNTTYRWAGLMLTSGSVNESSDARLKKEIQSIPDKLIELFSDVEPKMYVMDGDTQFGYIAQDVERALFRYTASEFGMEVAKQNKAMFNMVGQDESYLSLVYRQVSAVKDAQKDKQIKKLQQRLEALENGSTTTNSN